MNRKNILVCLAFGICFFMTGISYGADITFEPEIMKIQGSVSGFCYNDLNKNMEMDDDEPGIWAVTLSLKRIIFFGLKIEDRGTVQTDEDGYYIFSGLPRGLYLIEETGPEGAISTTKNRFLFFIGLFLRNKSINIGNFLSQFQEPDSPSVSITADPEIIQPGESSTLTWESENADTVWIDQEIGEVDAEGSLTVFPEVTTKYTITAEGESGTAHASVTVTVITEQPLPPPSSTSTTTTPVSSGGSSGGGGGSSSGSSGEGSATTTTPTGKGEETLILLSSFVATPESGKVVIEWATESEIDNAGFNLYRAKTENGKYIKINNSLIPAKGSPTEGSLYEFVDDDVENRQVYWYMLEDVDLNGVSTMHGPVSATPRLIYGLGK